MYEHLSGEIWFLSAFEIEKIQIFDYLDAFLEGAVDRPPTLKADQVVHGTVNGWLDKIRVEIASLYPREFIAVDRAQRQARHREFVDLVFQAWRQDTDRGFWDWFIQEADDHGRMIVRQTKEYVVRFLSEPNDPALPDLLMSASIQMMQAVIASISEGGTIANGAAVRAAEFLTSKGMRRVPFVHISALLHAATARKAAAGQRRPPSEGYFTDVATLAHLLPYCDAVLVDNQMRALLAENPLAAELRRYGTRIFSRKTLDAFLRYLDDIEDGASAEHLATVEDLYGPASTVESFASFFQGLDGTHS